MTQEASLLSPAAPQPISCGRTGMAVITTPVRRPEGRIAASSSLSASSRCSRRPMRARCSRCLTVFSDTPRNCGNLADRLLLQVEQDGRLAKLRRESVHRIVQDLTDLAIGRDGRAIVRYGRLRYRFRTNQRRGFRPRSAKNRAAHVAGDLCEPGTEDARERPAFAGQYRP